MRAWRAYKYLHDARTLKITQTVRGTWTRAAAAALLITAPLCARVEKLARCIVAGQHNDLWRNWGRCERAHFYISSMHSHMVITYGVYESVFQLADLKTVASVQSSFSATQYNIHQSFF